MTSPPPISTVAAPDSAPAAYTDIHGAASYFDVSYWTVRRWIQRGQLASVRLPGGIIRIRIADLDALGESVR
ncbi:MAG: excisionase family DNA-binding protein [Mycobacterium sp.]